MLRTRQRADRVANKLSDPKSRAGRRDVPIGPALIATLREWKLKQPFEQRRLDLVFPSETGGGVDHANLWRRFQALQVAIGITEPQLAADGRQCGMMKAACWCRQNTDSTPCATPLRRC